MFEEMKEDINAAMRRDPAAKSRLEIALCYPGLHAIWLHRIAHVLYRSPFLFKRLGAASQDD